MKAKLLNNKQVHEFLRIHAFSNVCGPRENKLSNSFMVMKTQKAWVEFETNGGYCTGFSLGPFGISFETGGISHTVTISF